MPAKKAKHEEQEVDMMTTVTDLTKTLKGNGVHPVKKNAVADDLDRLAADAKKTVEDWRKKRKKK